MRGLAKIDFEMDIDGVGPRQAWFHELGDQPGNLVIDLAGVTRLDGSGLGALVHVHKRKRANGFAIELANVNGQPRAMLEEFGLATIFQVQPAQAAHNVTSIADAFSRTAARFAAAGSAAVAAYRAAGSPVSVGARSTRSQLGAMPRRVRRLPLRTAAVASVAAVQREPASVIMLDRRVQSRADVLSAEAAAAADRRVAS
jgi:anti-anti-sigma factor